MKSARFGYVASQSDDFASIRGKRLLHISCGIVFGAIFAWLFIHQIDGREVMRRLAGMRAAPLVLGMAAYCVAFLLRAVRFWLMLRMAGCRSLRFGASVSPFIASFGISDLLPLRAGDAFRVLWFTRGLGVPATTTVSAMLVERLLDLAAIIAIGTVAFAVGQDGLSAPLTRQFGLVFAFALLGLGFVMFAPRLMGRWLPNGVARTDSRLLRASLEIILAASITLAQIGSGRRIAGLLLLSLPCWLLEGVLFIGAWISLGGAPGELVAPSLAFVSSTLGTLVPSLPGHFGPFEYFGMEAFAMAGVGRSFAAAVLLTAHLMLWAPTALFAIFWLMIRSPARQRTQLRKIA